MNITYEDQDYLHYIIKQTKTHNIDNITRTHAYQNFYFCFPEIKWTLVASLVSRNAGWNMTDLTFPQFKKLLGKKERNRLFMTYERANWLIFSDAYPQLLTYKLSCKLNKPMFHLLSDLQVSAYMEKEWKHFWKYRDRDRLMTALIINEQNNIHEPVLKQPFFRVHVFHALPFRMQNLLYINAVILPSTTFPLAGAFVHDFTKLSNRIALGKHLASVIFSPNHYSKLIDFTINERHTGSRWDYEKYLNLPFPKSPSIHKAYPPITHQDNIRNDWYKWRGVNKNWLHRPNSSLKTNIGESFYRKRTLLFVYASLA
ncbi:hypothetical protein CFK37_14985 [Virgibacillus phasianinus]|uniref:DUF2515 domain-containing protein n=1 Tax=Virgibacillus phasianinus TaxID=2017483 RepID=A0A220U5H8_9BACI|nr:DUF2515 family protein [Virgibacillus phasianinus]ASK63369.1 hypothetical protein CFK37_14985 [Virgibacillus phasianinus]